MKMARPVAASCALSRAVVDGLGDRDPPGGPTPPTPRPGTWAALVRRELALDLLACPRCAGLLRVIAAVQNPLAVQTILAHLDRSAAPLPPGPAPPAPAVPA